jgi:formamidopyrimidine-DNA glycosylase
MEKIMPEGPECRRIGENLAKFCSNKMLTSIEILSGRYTKNLPTGFELLANQLPIGVVGIGVHGKFIYWILREEFSIWNTLGMSGSWRTEPSKHARVKINFSDGNCIYFTDQRNFGTLKFVKGKHHLIEKLKSLGPDMLADDVSGELFIQRLRKKNNHNICKADELLKLNHSIKQVIRESYKSGGATIQTYQNINGEIGQYSSRFLVYNRKEDPDGNIVTKEMTPDGRRTFWSPAVQK